MQGDKSIDLGRTGENESVFFQICGFAIDQKLSAVFLAVEWENV
jgi:hypothetical protein